ncbi:catalase, partial [Pelomonas sp. KK5]|uniref:catalase n=1 Tax=Pelomonas sp. KK5 TaxID=1855730 RepID=UPI0035142180
MLAGADPDFQRRDLFQAITAGNFPEWELAIDFSNDPCCRRLARRRTRVSSMPLI